MGNKIVHVDFYGSNRNELTAWYASLFDWKIQNMDEYDYSTFAADENSGGGFATAVDGKPLVIPYISVNDVQAKMDEIVAKGGMVSVELTVMPEVTFAICIDPQGNQVGLVLDPEA